MFKEFKEFISKGNVMDLAVGVIIGGAFKAIVDSLVNDIIMPIITMITGKNWFCYTFLWKIYFSNYQFFNNCHCNFLND